MSEQVCQRHDKWHVAKVLRQHPTLRIVPSGDEDLCLAGTLPFHVVGPDGQPLCDEYEIEIAVPPGFPRDLALARETGGRIPKGYHKLEGDYLCLATHTAQRFVLFADPTLPGFLRLLLIPYLYGYSYYEQHGVMVFEEQEHGDQGVLDQLGQLYHAQTVEGIEEFLRLTGLRKRVANKRPCPCQSGRRLGRCHNREVNALRKKLGRLWFRAEYELVCEYLGKPGHSKRHRIGKAPSLRELLQPRARPMHPLLDEAALSNSAA